MFEAATAHGICPWDEINLPTLSLESEHTPLNWLMTKSRACPWTTGSSESCHPSCRIQGVLKFCDSIQKLPIGPSWPFPVEWGRGEQCFSGFNNNNNNKRNWWETALKPLRTTQPWHVNICLCSIHLFHCFLLLLPWLWHILLGLVNACSSSPPAFLTLVNLGMFPGGKRSAKWSQRLLMCVHACAITFNMWPWFHTSHNNFTLISSLLPHTVVSESSHLSYFIGVKTETQRGWLYFPLYYTF